MRLLPSFVLIIAGFVSDINAKPKAKSNPDADPKAWDWQNEPHNLPVFSPYPFSKVVDNQPSFLKINRNVSVMVGETAHLPCRVKNLDRYTVSWIRARDVTVLSVGHLAFSSDARIGVVQVARPLLSAGDWNLSIENSSLADDGLYECQVNTEPKINYKVFLSVQDPADALQKDSPYYEVVDKNHDKKLPDYQKTHSLVKKHHITQIEKEGFSMYLHDNGCICPRPQIVPRGGGRHGGDQEPEMKVTGGPIIYARAGSAVTLECAVSGLAAAPAVLRWTRSGEDDLSASVSPRTRDGVSLDTERAAGTSRVSLYLRRAQLTDTGNYTCVADRVSRTVLVVVTGPSSATPLPRPLTQSSGSAASPHMILILVTSLLLSATSWH